MLSNIRITVGSVDPEHYRAFHGVARANEAVLRATVSVLQSKTTIPRTISYLTVQFYFFLKWRQKNCLIH
jgi:hypothetical protein